MARTEIIRITCDICGAVIDTAVGTGERAFAVDAQPYTIDLCITHTSEFDTLLAPFMQAGRSTSTSRPARVATRRRPTRSAAAGGSPKEIREWARANGFARVSERGRVPSDILAAWHAAHTASDGATSADAATASALPATESAAEAPACHLHPAAQEGGRHPQGAGAEEVGRGQEGGRRHRVTAPVAGGVSHRRGMAGQTS